jgi:transcriptional regulator with XRE-family HTH domain
LRLPRLKEVRELHGWSQKKLAEESGVSRDSISNYETSQREAWPATARKLADALGVQIADLREPAREPAVPLGEDPPAGRVEDEDLDKWLKSHNARRILMSDEEILDNFERLASGPDRAGIPERFEQEARESFREEDKVLDALRAEWTAGGSLLPQIDEGPNVVRRAFARSKEYSRVGRDIRSRYSRYLRGLDYYGEALYLEGRADDFVMIGGRPRQVEARMAAIRALREEAFKNSRGA